MAAAFRVFDRAYRPANAPLEDLNPTTAHLKQHEVSSLQRLKECTLGSGFTGGLPYPRPADEERTEPFDINELIVLNIYKFAIYSPKITIEILKHLANVFIQNQ